MNKYLRQLYRRGFVLTDIAAPKFRDKLTQQIVQSWKKERLSSYFLFFDNETSFGCEEDQGYKVIVLGQILNPFDGKNDIDEITRILLLKKIKSEDIFLDYLDQLSGRFVIFTSTPSCTEIYHDACATRTVFYDTSSDATAVSSHSMLIADLFDYQESKYVKKIQKHPDFRRIRYLPGLQTPFDQIKPLTPNTKYIIEQRMVKRIFPRYPINENVSTDQLIDELITIMQSQAKMLSEKYKLSISLTAGIDSRLTYAMFRNIEGDVDYFTHVNLSSPESYQEDIDIAKKLASIGEAPYQIYEYEFDQGQESLSDFSEIWKKNVGMNRGSVYLFKMYADKFPSDRLHVRSNLAEIGRVYYKRSKNQLNSKGLAQLYTRTSLKNDQEVLDRFEEFIKVTQFNSESLFNYNYFDLFYWEHRMCLWHSLILLESDMAYDTHIIYNNRILLMKMLSVPYEVRNSQELFLKMIDKTWTELLDLPINGQFLKVE